ncbi:transferrin receptor 1a [Triplophysa dalaica]|uniref:transferrin receptor 1a n=1 Tax=Triplophysa dalaica TaxID=1582913 RepID=UPI0024DFA041|nr:transferrin receptor 1a [Triplophysa dalaica]XP_056599786.1 transferrin receptor 1a [Triplophysa dalaica]XP_056599787.1 transferrin receptor 1a [Triplophysa dalaica]
MDQARTTISKIFNGEPRSYTRFNLTQNMEGENSQVEMKLSSDMDEEVEANGVGENMKKHNGPYYPSKLSQRSPKTICCIVIGILLLFISGYLIGYLSHRSKNNTKDVTCPDTVDNIPGIPDAPVFMDWSDIRALLKKKLTASNIKDTLREFSSANHQAGTSGDEQLANNIVEKFKALRMTQWTDEHYVKIVPTSSNNRVLFRGNAVGSTEGFLAYSAARTAEGPALYAHYGRPEDFRRLEDMKVNVNGTVVLVRAGKIGFAEKVANAERLKASAVLIYPDLVDYKINDDTALFGHVHLGTGDPYTPGFPSFNHTQFPPARSSGLPNIPAQTITIKQATEIMKKMGGQVSHDWRDGLLRDVNYNLGDNRDVITVEVNNALTEKKIHNVFGVIKGYVDEDQYVLIGAQRDAWGSGYAKSTVGTSLLVELAKTITNMIKNDGLRPKRSIVFASWSAGEYGHVGATEWLEGYLTSLNMKVVSYISLDGVVSGSDSFKASASPLLYDLIESTMKQVSFPGDETKSLHEQFSASNWEKSIIEPMRLFDSIYTFQTFTGVPSFSFRFTSSSKQYPYDTLEDTEKNLDRYTFDKTLKLAKAAGEVAGLVTLRLVHDHLIRLNVAKYTNIIRNHVSQIRSKVESLQGSGRLPNNLTMLWLLSAQGSYDRAASTLLTSIHNSDLGDLEQCRILNRRIMRVEGTLLSPFVSPRETPFRHILLGSGEHTLAALLDHLNAIKEGLESADVDQFKNQFALATWTIQGCANTLAGEVWNLDNQI